MASSGTPRALRLGLLGHPVGHSLSPALHRAALEAVGLRGDYALFDVEASELPGWVARLRAGELDGLNVTIPHKLAVAPLCDELEGAAGTLGAVNTLTRSPAGAVIGYNTDVSGLARAVREAFPGLPLAGRVVGVVGAGGAGHAAVLAADALGAGAIRLCNRSLARAEGLASRLGPHLAARIEVHGLDAVARGAALVLQATSLGMGLAPGSPPWQALQSDARAWLAGMAADGAVLDLVYRPEDTPWCAAARALGRSAAAGLGMLVHQAAEAFALWTGREPPRETMTEAARRAM